MHAHERLEVTGVSGRKPDAREIEVTTGVSSRDGDHGLVMFAVLNLFGANLLNIGERWHAMVSDALVFFGAMFMARASLAFALLVILASCPCFGDDTAAPKPPASYRLAKTLKIGGEGGWDYVTIDPGGKLLYLTRTSHTMIVDAATGKVMADLPGTKRAHGVALAPDANRGFITDGKAGNVVVFDLAANKVLGTIEAADDADGIVYDPASHRVWIACGDAGVVVPITVDADPRTGKADAPVQLGGKPEFLVADGHGRLFVASQDKNEVVVIDTHLLKAVAHWPTLPGTGPTGIAIDRDGSRLFVGCRNQKMMVMNAADGAVIADLPIGKGVDATAWIDGSALASCGDGTLTVIKKSTSGDYAVSQTLTTEPGARTMAVDPASGKIYLATADFEPATAGSSKRPKPVVGTFRILIAEPATEPPAH